MIEKMDRKRLIKCLNVLQKATGSKNTPFDGCVVIRADGKQLHLRCADLGSFLSATVKIDCTDPAFDEQIVDLKALLLVLRHLPAAQISVAEDPKGILLRCGNRVISVLRTAISLEDLPPVVPTLCGDSFEISAENWANALAYVAPAQSTDKCRENLCGVFFDGKFLVATDGHRLHRHDLCTSFNGELILPSKLVATMQKVLSLPGAVRGSFKRNGKYVHFALINDGGVSFDLIAQLIESKFPPWKSIIPTEPANFVVGTTGLFSAVKLAGAVSAAESVQFEDDGGRLMITTENSTESLELISGSVLAKVFLNSHYVVQALSGFGDETTVSVVDSLAPVLFRSGEKLAVVMPKRESAK